MKRLSNLTKYIPYLYFISILSIWFTRVNRVEGIWAYPILLLMIPLLWQIIKPNKKLNFTLGISFVCISSYLILAAISSMLNIISLSYSIKQLMIYGGLFVFGGFAMALWMIRNSLKEHF